ncbi:MAG: MBL fold metallo-hydrolase [Clostridium sp.]
MIKIKFLGAAKCVTGSCHMVTIDDINILFDCGLFQSHDESDYENEELKFDPKDINFVILSHSHVDHSGRIPLLYKKGYEGSVFCTKPTVDLSEVKIHILKTLRDKRKIWSRYSLYMK